MTSLSGGCDIQCYSIVTMNQRVCFLAFILFLYFFFCEIGSLPFSGHPGNHSVDQGILKLREIEPIEMCASAS